MKKNKNRKKILFIVAIILIIIALGIYCKGSIMIPYYLEGEFFMAEYVFRDTYNDHDIIGNPDFKPSFDDVDSDTFITEFKKQSDILTYKFEIKELEAERYYEKVYMINDIYKILYSEGFLKLVFKTENMNEIGETFEKIMKILMCTVDKELSSEEIDHTIKELSQSIEESNFHWEDYHIYGGNIRYDFAITEENGYEVHMEDLKMGH